jgi:hypothetical protein
MPLSTQIVRAAALALNLTNLALVRNVEFTVELYALLFNLGGAGHSFQSSSRKQARVVVEKALCEIDWVCVY